MIDLNNLIDLFPSYFKENDSYKVDGKGLLQRFLDICGNYFQQYPLADLDSFLENLDVNKTNIIFIQNFWKFFGELPFAQGPIIDGKIFTDAFTGFNFDEALNQALRSQTPFTGGDANLNYRKLIQYSISLFKIRGTRQFFDIMFRLYGVTVFIGTPTDEDPFESDIITRFDLEDTQYDKATYDHYYRCKNCSDVTFTITPPATISSQTDVLSFANQMRAFIERFVPFYINPVFVIEGWNTLNKVTLTVTPDSATIGIGESTTLQVEVKPVISNNTFPSMAYQVAVTETGGLPAESDWSQPYTERIYYVGVGNRDYHFRAVADKTIQRKVHVYEQYTNTQYMIWVESPTSAADKVLSKTKPKIKIEVVAQENQYTYRDGKIFKQVQNTPSITWDNTDQIFNNGHAEVEVDYYGAQYFSITSYPTKKAYIYIDATEEYKKVLDTIVLTLDPPYLLVKDNSYAEGQGSGSDISKLKAGVYGSEDEVNWTAHPYSTTFKAVNREGVPQPSAKITEVGGSSNRLYKHGDEFTPPGRGSASYSFKAQIGETVSETATLRIRTSDDTSGNINPRFQSITADPNPLTFPVNYTEPKAISGTLTVGGLTRQQAQNYTPQVVKVVSNSVAATFNCRYKEYRNGLAIYTFETTHTENSASTKSYYLQFYPKPVWEGAKNVKAQIQVLVIKTQTNLYLQPWPADEAQWSGMDKNDPTNNKNLTFKAAPGKTVARFTIEGETTLPIIGSDGKTYSVSEEGDDPYSIEVNGNSTLTLRSGDATLTIRLEDFAAVVEIWCEPKSATITSAQRTVKTRVSGKTNKSDKFRFRVDGSQTIYTLNSNDGSDSKEIEFSEPGVHQFTAVDDGTVTANFTVNSQISTQIQVTETLMSWDADDLSEKSFEVVVPENVRVTITEVTATTEEP